jgi:hypothetical protein
MIASFDVREPIERAKRFHEIKAQAGGGANDRASNDRTALAFSAYKQTKP